MDQLENAYANTVEAGQVEENLADELLGELDLAIAEIRETGKLTMKLSDPSVAQLFTPTNVTFLYQVDQRDPAALASETPSDVRRVREAIDRYRQRILAARTPPTVECLFPSPLFVTSSVVTGAARTAARPPASPPFGEIPRHGSTPVGVSPARDDEERVHHAAPNSPAGDDGGRFYREDPFDSAPLRAGY